MAATFRPVNPNLVAETIPEDAMTPSTSATPRPNTAPHHPHSAMAADDAKTPTRATFGSAAHGQKPLPSSPFPQGVQMPESSDHPRRENSQHSARTSSRRDSMDVDMDESDGEGQQDDGSDDESVNADGTKSNKKKKSQRFYCTDFPPCNLSFTRSEHLARHIRKHTGERPFQCHCSRRFSRLDNLRQHAQTVHVNEDIPIDSLAATGSRFQRQIRTERVRQAGNRARASTGGSAGGPPRGHSKSLSTSSIASISSVGSNYGPPQADARRRPPPLVMAADPRSRLSLESYRSAADSTYSYRPPSPGDFSTPTSATFSTAQSSPRWASGMASPTTAHSRSQSMYSSGNRTPGRRLSVPSGANPFHPVPQQAPGRPMFGPGSVNSSHPGAFTPSNSSIVTSPTASTSGWSGRRDSTSSVSDEAWRRRTWHPDSRSYSVQNNQLSAVGSQSVRPNPPPPIANPSNAQSSLRLPGIESFDPLPRRNASPMAVDADPSHRPMYPVPQEPMQVDERRNLNMYDASLQRGLNRLDIGHKTPPRDGAGAWASEANRAVQAQAEQVRQNPPTVRFEDQIPPSRQNPPPTLSGRSLHHQAMSAPSMATPRENKRHGWYHGPVGPQGGPPPPPQDPRVAHVDRMVHPNMNGFSGFPAREQQVQQPQQQERSANGDPLRRLEALVAVATSEGSTATAY
ncbi:C2H2 transcription factor [Purpureocillium lavendulum]|uniref:C2H2 transcription factor n=1 Tax=Purpureocillium lavendulum TaxID=1247861 RepID=A0AB34FQL2_9HYPO|nr:C2H2 transcription factor [Purpureocillium lavendulum]